MILNLMNHKNIFIVSIWISSIYIFTAIASSNVYALEKAGKKRAAECATCHIDWMPGLENKNAKPLVSVRPNILTKNGNQKISSTKRMCFTCHDGFVNDSRFQFVEGAHEHPIGVKPSKSIRILKSKEGAVYPLNEDGKLYCGTCHTAHGNDWNKSESALFMRSKNVDSSLCIDCHADHVKTSNNNHPMKSHKGKIPAELLAARSMFGKKQKVICQTCHRSHLTDNKKLLVVKSRNSQLCIICHEDKKQIIKSEHDLTNHKKRTKNAKGQSIAQLGPCSGCHVAHGGTGRPLLATTKNRRKNDVWSQCIVCHSKGGIAGETVVGKFSHPVDVEISEVNITVQRGKWKSSETNRKLKSLPLFDKHGKLVDTNGRVQCPTCHDTHGTAGDSKHFLRLNQGSDARLCKNCHIRQTNITNTKHNINLYDKEKQNKLRLKKQSKKGICYTCHATHTAKAPNMLTLVSKKVNKKARKGVSVIADHCSYCHKKNGAASDSALGDHSHPVSVSLSNGMKAKNLPLFTSKGKRSKNNNMGKIDCATCHNVHQWDPRNPKSKKGKKLDAKAHNGNSFLRFPADGDSVLCTNCHKNQAQVIDTDHDFRISAKWLENNKKQKVSKSGVCGQCHGAHNNESLIGLWARAPGKAKDAQASFCRSCHVENHRETIKIVPYGKHPDNVLVWSTPKRIIPGVTKGDKTPVFSLDGKRKDVGIISCPSCHDPHQWRGSKYGKGPGKEVEGSSMTSFLRKTSIGKVVCADCHGLDALFRYQYFHSKTNTKDHPLYIDLGKLK